MPQLIAMVIVVVGAMIYMFQTFGGTGDKIEGIAQKSSIITEINNIKSGIQLALRSDAVYNTSETEDTDNNLVTSLRGVGVLEFFPEQINNQLIAAAAGTNVYKAISFGGESNLEITLVLPTTDALADGTARPGLFIDLSKGSLATNAGFLEKQLIQDLKALASIDQHATALTYKALDADGDVTSPTAETTTDGIVSDVDGKFMIYFKDLPRGMIKSK